MAGDVTLNTVYSNSYKHVCSKSLSKLLTNIINRFELIGIYYNEGLKSIFTTFIFMVEFLACSA